MTRHLEQEQLTRLALTLETQLLKLILGLATKCFELSILATEAARLVMAADQVEEFVDPV